MVHKLFLSVLVLCLCVFAALPAPAEAPPCGASSNVYSINDLEEVLFVVSGKIIKEEQRSLKAETIKSDIRSALEKAGIEPEIVAEQESINRPRFLKIHIYSIMLERQVYFCSAEIIQQQQPSQKECAVSEYSNIVSRARDVRKIVQGLMVQVVQNRI